MQTSDVRRFMEAAVDKLSPSKARELAKELLEGGASREQLQKAQQELLDWSARNRDRLLAVVRQEVKRQLTGAGFATREELEAVRKRVRKLEKAADGSAPKKGAKRSSAKTTVKATAETRAGETSRPRTPGGGRSGAGRDAGTGGDAAPGSGGGGS
jgi:polyhydroxyalkanoate synthesis regulator phasin